MQYIEYGGVPKYGLPLGGWPKYGIPGGYPAIIAPIVPYHRPGAGVGGFEYPDPYERRRKEMREIKEIVMILSELN